VPNRRNRRFGWWVRSCNGTVTPFAADGAARNAFNILPTDIGRRITELRPNVDNPDLENILRDVTETFNMRERKVKDLEGHDYSLRVRPYRTTDNKIDGAVITLVELGGKKGSHADTTNRTKQVFSHE
jgi:hypothetical protein